MQVAGQMVATCAPADIDATTGQCTNLQWVQQTAFGFPPLTAAQGFEICGAIAVWWGVGFYVRMCRKTAGV